MKKYKLVNSKTIFIATLVVVPTLIFIVFLSGIRDHRSLYLNSLISTTILSIVFILFITTGLYNGWKLKDTVGRFTLKINFAKPPDLTALEVGGLEFPDADDESVGAVITAIILWIIIAVFASVVLYYVGGGIWLTLLALAGILYWIIFRAFRLVFKQSRYCQGRLFRSLIVGFSYTVVYNCWIYGIIFLSHYLSKKWICDGI